MPPNATRPAPRLFWLVATAALLWAGYRAVDWGLTVTGHAAYLAPYTPAQRAFLTTLPLPLTAVWGLSAGAGLAGAVALLARRRVAVVGLAVALAAMGLAAVLRYAASDWLRVIGSGGVQWVGVVAAGLAWAGLVLYAREQARRGVLY